MEGVRRDHNSPSSKTRISYLDADDKVAEVVARGGRGVATHDILAVDVGHDRDMLSDRQVQNIILVWQSKLVPEKTLKKKGDPKKKTMFG